MILHAWLWDEDQIDTIAEAIEAVQPPPSEEDLPDYYAECACAVVEALVGPRDRG